MKNTPEFEIPESLRELAEKSVGQAKESYVRFMDAARQAQDMVKKSSDAMASGARDIQDKAIAFTTSNMDASFELAQRLVKARDMQEALQIQSEFARKQMETYASQAQELGRLMAQAAQKANPNT